MFLLTSFWIDGFFSRNFEYAPVFFFFLLVCGLFGGIAYFSALAGSWNARGWNRIEFLSSYECGFEPFGTAQSAIDIHFFLVGILFLIFDVEIVFLYLAIFAISEGSCMFSEMVVIGPWLIFSCFIGSLVIGLFYEVFQYAIKWFFPKIED